MPTPRDRTTGAALLCLAAGLVAYGVADAVLALRIDPGPAVEAGLVLVILGGVHLALGALTGAAPRPVRRATLAAVALVALGFAAPLVVPGAFVLPLAALAATLLVLWRSAEARGPAVAGALLLGVRAGTDVVVLGVLGAVALAAALVLCMGWRGPAWGRRI